VIAHYIFLGIVEAVFTAYMVNPVYT